ncbi:hypothetical protein CDL15_Pgr014576 [Punica granatum]|uniref:PNPLA domain-containing protein n=1 Tax=Punica granatum TaxID=22663 RepID=A0A218WED7_PUNGR|nr:hypothetical protein CDL15_Pgr014576 [Punica granatum]
MLGEATANVRQSWRRAGLPPAGNFPGHQHLQAGLNLLPRPPQNPQPRRIIPAAKVVKAVSGPKYNWKYLHMIVQEKLGSMSSRSIVEGECLRVKRKLELDAMLLDVCISTSAALTYLPEHYFETKDQDGKVQELNMIDGGVAATNLTLVVMGEVTKAITEGCSDFFAIQPMDCMRFLVISLGSGSGK